MNEFLLVSKNLEIRELSKDVEIDEPKIGTSHQNQEFLVTEADSMDHDNTTEVEQKESTFESDEKGVVSSKISKVGSKFQCPHPQCDKLFYDNSTARKHFRSIHEGVKYACNQCDQQFTQQGSLTTHIQSQHKGVEYHCNQCDHQFTLQSSLTRHMKKKHF